MFIKKGNRWEAIAFVLAALFRPYLNTIKTASRCQGLFSYFWIFILFRISTRVKIGPTGNVIFPFIICDRGFAHNAAFDRNAGLHHGLLVA